MIRKRLRCVLLSNWLFFFGAIYASDKHDCVYTLKKNQTSSALLTTDERVNIIEQAYHESADTLIRRALKGEDVIDTKKDMFATVYLELLIEDYKCLVGQKDA